MPEKKGAHYLDPIIDRAEQYKYVRNPDVFLAEDSLGSFVDVKKALKNNPEKHGSDTAILAACYMAFGSERVNLEKLGPDVYLARLNAFFIAYNDQVDVAEKIKESDPDVYEVIMKHVRWSEQMMNKYFEPTGDPTEDARRQKLKEIFDDSLAEIGAVEHELFQVSEPDYLDHDQARVLAEQKHIQQGRELVNAIEMLVNIRACAELDIYQDREIDKKVTLNIESLAKKYAWIIDPDFSEDELTVDERKARMLFFSVMANQAVVDGEDIKEDAALKVWKKSTYLTEVLKLSPQETRRALKADEDYYADLAAHYGMSPAPLAVANTVTKGILKLKNAGRGFLAKRAKRGGHLRELALTMLQRRHPEKYQI